MRISIIIPLFNQERYIVPCLNSCLEQEADGNELEIIVVNDCSTDCSLDRIRAIAANHNNIHIINKTNNEGVEKARFTGLDNATGKYVLFVDADDMLAPGAIRTFLKYEHVHADVICGNYMRFVDRWKILHKVGTFGNDVKRGVLIKQPELLNGYYYAFFGRSLFPVSMWGKLYRRDAILRANYIPTGLKHGEDFMFNFHLFPHLESMVFIDDVVYHYRYGGMTSKYIPSFYETFISFQQRITFLDQHGFEQGYVPLFNEYATCLATVLNQRARFNISDYSGNIAFLNAEFENRPIVNRMIEYFRGKDSQSPLLRHIIAKDSQSFYNAVVKPTSRLSIIKNNVLSLIAKL